jgi:hypothetical protein
VGAQTRKKEKERCNIMTLAGILVCEYIFKKESFEEDVQELLLLHGRLLK